MKRTNLIISPNFPDLKAFEEFSRAWITEAMRCLSEQGSLFIFCSNRSVGPIGRMLLDMGINSPQYIQVVKTNGRPLVGQRTLQYSHHTIIWVTKSRTDYRFNQHLCRQTHWADDPFSASDAVMKDVWVIPTSSRDNKTGFPAQKRVEVYERILTMCGKPGGSMLDLFSGSGTGAIAAMQWGMRCTSIERDAGYVADIIKRIQREPARLASPIIASRTDITDLIDTIVQSDCRRFTPGLPTDAVDATVTSFPFHRLRRYNGRGIGNEHTVDEYLSEIVQVTRECLRVTRGAIAVEIGDRREGGEQLMIPNRFYTALRAAVPNMRLINECVGWRRSAEPRRNHSNTRNLIDLTTRWFILTTKPDYHFDSSEWNPSLPSRPGARIGSKYRHRVIETTTLTSVEKTNALAAIDDAIATVKRGEAQQFRMFIRGLHHPNWGRNAKKGIGAARTRWVFRVLLAGQTLCGKFD
jgi:DNA modification methylase